MALELDEIDLKILEALRKDARTPFVSIARELGMSDSTVHFRLKKMIDAGVIKRYTIEVDEKVLGRNIYGFVFINVQPGSIEEVAKQLIEYEKVSGIYEIHGSYALMIKVWANNLDGIRDIILKIRKIPSVLQDELSTILKVWKET